MDKFKNIFIKLGQLDRRLIFFLIALSVLIPLLKPGWVNIPIKTTSHSEIVFEELNNLNKGDRVLVSFEYGASTKPEIHPMSVAVLQHLFSKGIKVYTVPLWPEGLMMAKYALKEVVESNLFNIKEHIDYVSLPYKAGGEIIIRGIATNIRSIFTQDVNNILLIDIPMMDGVNKVTDFDFVFDLSAGTPGNAEWVQFACDEYNVPLSSGCTSIMVTDAIPYVESGQIRGILAGMPGAAEYEQMVFKYLSDLRNSEILNENASIVPGKATSRMSAQSVAHLLMVIFIILGNISYYLIQRRND
jgi:hypothetical protein